MKEQLALLVVLLFQTLKFTVADPSTTCPDKNLAEVTFIADDSDCSIFYQCQWGEAYKYDCPVGLHFDSIIQVCNYPELANCGGSVNNGGGSNEDTNVNVEESNENNSNENTDEQIEDDNAVGECPEEDGEYVTLLPHSSNCSKFFICNRGTPVLSECQDNLLFNSVLLVCDYPESAGCGANSSNGDNESGEGSVNDGNDADQSNEISGGSDDTENNAGDDNAVGECPEVDGEYVTLLPHSSDCRKFFICNEGVPVVGECPGNLLFNPNLLVCDYSENAGCGENSSDKDSETDDGNVVNGSGEDQTNENNGSDNSENNAADGNAVGECPEVDGEYVTLLPHSSDCRKFFICNEGTPVVAECPDNLLFNPNLLVCDYPENAGCGENSSNEDSETDDGNVVNESEEEQTNENNGSDDTENNAADGNAVGECPEVDGEIVTLLPHSSDCSKFFICNEGTPVVSECPGNLLFNPGLLVCDYPENSGCGQNSSDVHSETDDGNVVNGNEEEETNGSNGSDDTENNAAGGNAVGECPEVDGEYVTLLPHSSDCRKFFICNEGVPVVAECPGNLLFNPNLLVCDYPENAGCGENSSDEDSETDDGNVANGNEEEQTNENNGSDDTENNAADGNAVGECPEVDGEYVSLLPHSTDCKKFFICNEGTPVVAECPGNLLFNPDLLVCDYPEKAGCGQNSSDGHSETDDGNMANGSEEDQSNENSGSEDIENNAADGNAVGECPEVDGEYVTLLPHTSDCSKFFICIESVPVVAECPGNLLFNPNLLVCDYPENAGCGENSSDEDSETDDCNVVNGSQEEQTNENNGSDNTENNAADGNAVGECPEVDGEIVTLLPHSSDCSKFFICNEGTPVVAECPGNLLFNPDLLVCDYAENAGCEENSSDGHSETDDGNGANGSEEDQSNENNGSEDIENNAADGNAVGECPEVDGEYVTLLPHTSDCSKFFICIERIPVVAECPGNLLFNPNILVCDYPENAGCGENSSDEDSETDDGNVVNGSGEDQINENNGSDNSENNAAHGNAVGECPEVDGEYVTLLPHSSDCRKFFICNEGTPVVAECPDNLLFNPNFLVCDYAGNAGCGY